MMTDEQRATAIEAMKEAIAEKFAPAIDFRAPYAKVMLDVGATAALDVALRVLGEAGLVLVPVEPTDEMLSATEPAFKHVNDMLSFHQIRTGTTLQFDNNEPPIVHAYRAMIAARPR